MSIDNVLINTEPLFKGSSLQMPLSTQSGHARHTHDSWPCAVLKRSVALCSNPAMKRRTLDLVTNRFRMFLEPSVYSTIGTHTSALMLSSLS